MCVYLFDLCCCFFFQWWLHRSKGHRRSREVAFERRLKVILPFLSDQKIGGQLAPSHASISPKYRSIRILIANLFSIVERSDNCAIKGKMAHHSLCGKGLLCMKFVRFFACSICYCEVYINFWGVWGIYEVFLGVKYPSKSLGGGTGGFFWQFFLVMLSV